MSCALCSRFVLDHFETSARITFPARSKRVPIHQILRELERAFFPMIESPGKAKCIQQQCQTMEIFCGKEQTTRRFFECYPYYNEVIEALTLSLWEAGVGKREIIHIWLQEEFYRLFHLLLSMHLEHTGQEEPKSLLAPPLYERLGPAAQARVDAQKGCAKDDTKAVMSGRDVDDSEFDEDDLYR